MNIVRASATTSLLRHWPQLESWRQHLAQQPPNMEHVVKHLFIIQKTAPSVWHVSQPAQILLFQQRLMS